MLKYAIVFAVISLVAGALGFGGMAAGATGIAKIFFRLFLILALVFIVLAALGVGAAKKSSNKCRMWMKKSTKSTQRSNCICKLEKFGVFEPFSFCVSAQVGKRVA